MVPFAQPESWDMRFIGRLLGTASTVILAYLLSVVLFAAIDKIATSPSGPLWDPSFSIPFRFVLLVVAVIGLALPLARSDSEGASRDLPVAASAFLVIYSVLKLTGLADPDIPLAFGIAHIVTPVRHLLRV